jgi:hypothetical protein
MHVNTCSSSSILAALALIYVTESNGTSVAYSASISTSFMLVLLLCTVVIIHN